MKLADQWFRHTLIHPKYKDVYDVAFYSGMEAAAQLLKNRPNEAERIRDEIARDQK